ncbi:PH domain-containing protein [Paraglaciecola aquimarina]|uniref:PH domain-containing protein n=1 Tax=Paraglaciecola aquimarina TaxID=1235557 RepID=A0ABU3SY71_9ALTE|nr:PH domain-containing protein [Paraglaciecola aquimarina]MDU0354867.1 PH domain-containing protein [Paraglaciecola aquimarina]
MTGAATSTGIFIILCALIYIRWTRWGIACDEQYIYIRKGLFGVDYYCFPIFKIQQTTFKQSILQKNSKLASVQFVLASGSLKIPLISQALAYKLINESLFTVESSEKSWM